MTQLTADRVTLTYERKPVVRDLSLSIEPGTITTIIGPNGCGKSTLLRSLVRLMTPSEGSILLDGTIIDSVPTREVAKKLGLLSQHAIVPDGATVGDLVLLGRYPHQAFLQTPSSQDIKVVDHSLELAGMMELRDRPVAELSGGQRQRAWIAMALAQETPVLLLDEPTTFLDVAHQMEVMDLVVQLNREENRTIVMALHDINEAARVSDRLVAMRDGRIIGDGPPAEILTAQLLEELYGIDCDLLPHPTLLKCPNYCLPRSAMMRARAARDTSHGFNIVNARTSYGDRVVSDELSLNIPGGKITATPMVAASPR